PSELAGDPDLTVAELLPTDRPRLKRWKEVPSWRECGCPLPRRHGIDPRSIDLRCGFGRSAVRQAPSRDEQAFARAARHEYAREKLPARRYSSWRSHTRRAYDARLHDSPASLSSVRGRRVFGWRREADIAYRYAISPLRADPKQLDHELALPNLKVV